MATFAAGLTEAVLYDTLINYLISMARVVESAMNRSLDAIVGLDNSRTAGLPGEVFLLEPRINEMEIMIDEHAIRLLRRGSFTDDEMRLIVAALKITNDLERIGDIAVNLAERVISLREMPGATVPDQLSPMAEAVRSMVSRSLGALIFRNADLAAQVLESDDDVDHYRDTIFENLLQHMTQDAALVSPGMQFVLATRHLERIADHATNIAEDIIFWVRGLDVRHGRGLTVRPDEGETFTTAAGEASASRVPESKPIEVEATTTDADTREIAEGEINKNSHALHSDVTQRCETQRV